jgi:hypothetical protein
MLDRLEVFVGRWSLSSPMFGGGPEVFSTFGWELGRRFLAQRTEIPQPPEAPDSLAIIAPDADGAGYTQHYFDSRGVVRLYAMTFDGREWTLSRETADFSELPFKQRWTSTVSDDGSTIEGRWERTDGPDGDWMVDFELTYRRV